MRALLTSALLWFAVAAGPARAQVVTSLPLYPIDRDSCTLVFDAAQGNGELLNVTPPIYAHTGVITDQSASPSDWKYVVAGWTENTPKALMTPLGNNRYQLKIKPSVRGYYNVPTQETILKMAFVFRNADGSKVGRNEDGSDIFVDIYPDELSVNIVQPDQDNLFPKAGDTLLVSAVSPAATGMQILLNGTVVKTSQGQTIFDTLVAESSGPSWFRNTVKITATNGMTSVADSFMYTVIPPPVTAELPSGMVDGINYIDSATVLLSLYAPYKDHVFVIGDFNGWQPDSAFYMKVTPDQTRYWVQIGGLVPRQEYIFQYLVDGTLRIGDPYADKVSDPDDQYILPKTYPGLKPYPYGKTSGIATFLQTARPAYPWNTTPFTPPAVTDLVIYEILLRDFTADHDFPSLIDTLDYLKRLGVNAIELMPVMEFEGNISWGYNPNYVFALDKYYGTSEGLKRLVEEAHMRGIAVILDIVCNHQFGSSPLARLYWDAANNRPAANSPWFNPVPRHPYNVGNDFNHETPFTRQYMRRLLKHWLTEYRIDGFRFDLSKGLTQKNSYPNDVSLWGQYDASRISILTDYVTEMHTVNPAAYAIMEHFADNSEEQVLASRNMLLWGNMNGSYNEATMGWHSGGKSDFSWISWKKRGWNGPNVIGYMESHDEERLAFKNIMYGNAVMQPYYNIKDTGTSLKRLELASVFFFTVPGPKMIWQFGELGYDYSINSNGGRLAPKPIRWDYLNDWRRKYTHDIFSLLANLKQQQPLFTTSNYSLDAAGAIKRIHLSHNTMDATILGNFDVIQQAVNPSFTRPGTWYELFTGDSLLVTDLEVPLTFAPGEYRLYTTTRIPKPSFTGSGEPGPVSGTMKITPVPNPSDGNFTLMVELPYSALTEIRVYDQRGTCLSVVEKQPCKQGMTMVAVKLSPPGGRSVPAGLYFVRATAGSLQATCKVIVP